MPLSFFCGCETPPNVRLSLRSEMLLSRIAEEISFDEENPDEEDIEEERATTANNAEGERCIFLQLNSRMVGAISVSTLLMDLSLFALLLAIRYIFYCMIEIVVNKSAARNIKQD